MKRARRHVVLGALVVVPALLGLTACTRFGASLSRPSDPVVLDGTALPKLIGGDPAHIVGFSWDGKAWHQIPVQVDERDLVSPGVIYHRPPASYPNLFGTTTPVQDPRLHAASEPGCGIHGDRHHLHAQRLQPEVRQQRPAVAARERHRRAGRQFGREPGRGRPRPRAKRSRPPTRSQRRTSATRTSSTAPRSPAAGPERRASSTRSASTRATTKPRTRWERAR